MKRIIGWLMLFSAMTAVLIGFPYAVGGWECVGFVLVGLALACAAAAWIIKALDLIEPIWPIKSDRKRK